MRAEPRRDGGDRATLVPVAPARRAVELPLLFAHLLALAFAVGAPLFFGAVVAPASFRVLPTRDLAASLQSPMLTGLCWALQGAFLVLLASSFLLTRWWGAPKLSRALLTRGSILGIIGAVVIEKLLIPPIDRIRQEAPGLIDDLPAGDPGRLLLERYHRLATGLFTLEIGVALVILFVTARVLLARRASPRPAAAKPAVPKLLDLS